MVLLSLIPLLLAGNALSAEWDPIQRYGERLSFDIRRNDKMVGTHTVEFRRQGGAIMVEARSDVALEFLHLTFYRHRYQSRSEWRGGRLVRLQAQTNDNGRTSMVQAARRGALLEIGGPAGNLTTGLETLPTEHWNFNVVQASSVLNTISGRINWVAIVGRAQETIGTPSGVVAVDRYDYGGDLQAQVWYDRAGRWMRLRFAASDEAIIDYLCQGCSAQP